MRARRGITHLRLKLSFIEDEGAKEILDMLSEPEEMGELLELDLSNNMLSFDMCGKLNRRVRQPRLTCAAISINVCGNLGNAACAGFP